MNQNTKTSRHALKAFSTLLALQLISACTTEKVSPPPQPTLPNQQNPQNSPQQQEKNKSDSSGSSAAFVTQFESALAKRDCSTIRSLEKQLVAPTESYSNSVQLATLWCAHQKSPNEKELTSRLLAAIDHSIKNEAPLFDASFLEQLRADALSAAGDFQAARQSFAKALGQSALQFMNLVSGQALRSELHGLESVLTGAQAALLRDVRDNLATPLTQAAALTKFDELLSQVPPGSAKDKLLSARLKLFSAFELAFASQLAGLEEVRLKGDASATEELAGKVRQMFPSRPHQVRVDALVGSQSGNKASVADLATTQCNTAASNANGSNDKGELTAERALQLARIALNEGNPGDAVVALDNLSDAQKSDKTRSLRREASEAHIRYLRRKANELYQRGTIASDNQAKLDSLAQCKQILENILTRYPETDSFTRVKIQKFLNSVSENILELRKAQVK